MRSGERRDRARTRPRWMPDARRASSRAVDEDPDTRTVIIRRRELVDVARSRSRTLDRLATTRTRPRDLASSALFYGPMRDSVYACASAWVCGDLDARSREGLSSSSLPRTAHTSSAIAIPGTNGGVFVRNTPSAIEVDMEAVSATDRTALCRWIRTLIQSRHVMYGRHVVLVHAAEYADRAFLMRLVESPHAILVASTCKPDSANVRPIAGMVMRVRIPCEDAFAVPPRAQDALNTLGENPGVNTMRATIHRLRMMGFTPDEIARFATSVFARGRDGREPLAVGLSDVLARISHNATVASMDDRALEALVAVVLVAAPPH